MRTVTPNKPDISARITSQPDRLPVVLWAAGITLAAAAAVLRPRAILPSALATLGPFAILAVIIGCSLVADRLGVFRMLGRLLIPDRAPRLAAGAGVLALTALLSGLANLDVAVVVTTPVAMQIAHRHCLSAGRLAVAVAITANATSFLLPTSNITVLLLLSRAPLPTLTYLRGTWLPWLLVAAITIGPLSAWLARAGTGSAHTSRRTQGRPAGPSGRVALDLIPMFAAASAIRAILAAGIVLRGGIAAQLAGGAALASVANNLPAAAALRPVGTTALWAAVLATSIGPCLFLTGSVATLICRRIARDDGAVLRAGQYTVIGAVLVPAQLAVAVIGLHLTGGLG